MIQEKSSPKIRRGFFLSVLKLITIITIHLFQLALSAEMFTRRKHKNPYRAGGKNKECKIVENTLKKKQPLIGASKPHKHFAHKSSVSQIIKFVKAFQKEALDKMRRM